MSPARRVGILIGARLTMARRRGWPLWTLLGQTCFSTVLVLLVRDALPPFPYALVALTLGLLLLGIPLLSDLLGSLRADEGLDWLGSQPVRPREIALAKSVVLALSLVALSMAWFAPWSLLAPTGVAGGARVSLFLWGLVLVLAAGALATLAQAWLLDRLPSVMVAIETAWIALVLIVLLETLGGMRELALVGPGDTGWDYWPPKLVARAWIEGRIWLLVAILALSGTALHWLPERVAPPRRHRAGKGWTTPIYWLATRFWVRADERASFDLVFLALPREREFTLRTYPLLGIPLAFLWVSASEPADAGRWRGDLLALLLFTSSLGLPLLLTHVPLSDSPQAAWIQRLAPCPFGAHQSGAIKGLFARWIVPLYLALLALGMALDQGGLVLRLWLPAVLMTLVALRWLYPRLVRDLPLSRSSEELDSPVDWAGMMFGLATLLTAVAVAARQLTSVGPWLAVAAGLVGLEAWLQRRQRAQPS